MERLSLWPGVLGLALAMGLVTVLSPTPHSLSYASASIVIIALLGWVMEARAVAGPPPEVEPEHEEEEEEAPGPSYWPVVLAVGIVGIAVGLVYEEEYLALAVAGPLALASAVAWGNRIKAETPAPDFGTPDAPAPIVGTGGRIFQPVGTRALAAQAAGGAAIAIEQVEPRQISRRTVLQLTFWTGLLGGVGALAGVLVDMLYPRGITGFGSTIIAGTVDEFPPGSKTEVPSGKFWLVNLTAEQGGPGLLALWWKCPHLGCTVPFRENFSFVDPATNQSTRGWFRCPCHGSTYDHAGVRVFGPAPRSMDRMEIIIDPTTKRVSVNTGAITKGTPDNAAFAVKTEG